MKKFFNTETKRQKMSGYEHQINAEGLKVDGGSSFQLLKPFTLNH